MSLSQDGLDWTDPDDFQKVPQGDKLALFWLIAFLFLVVVCVAWMQG